ncbi:hypothetical protein GQ43DRAFT_428040 [Delitschia confertaspora ATCC 74209]|uniref:Uncharacterized protein n=1 Tax=Delitschia confertaspora ATCC 74209 TaxID=1513339 RepID=A0A9P4JUA4_9PLEO|nr:hypothetical protein GQ43DRAFT_428040 [Delitschia confertaspora ATCC 74209]
MVTSSIPFHSAPQPHLAGKEISVTERTSQTHAQVQHTKKGQSALEQSQNGNGFVVETGDYGNNRGAEAQTPRSLPELVTEPTSPNEDKHNDHAEEEEVVTASKPPPSNQEAISAAREFVSLGIGIDAVRNGVYVVEILASYQRGIKVSEEA